MQSLQLQPRPTPRRHAALQHDRITRIRTIIRHVRTTQVRKTPLDRTRIQRVRRKRIAHLRATKLPRDARKIIHGRTPNRLRGRNRVTSLSRVQKMHRDPSLNPARRSLNRGHNPSVGLRHSPSHGRRSLNHPSMKRNLSRVRSLKHGARRSPDRNLINRPSLASSLGHNRSRGQADIPLRSPLTTGVRTSPTIMASTRMVSRRSEGPLCTRGAGRTQDWLCHDWPRSQLAAESLAMPGGTVARLLGASKRFPR